MNIHHFGGPRPVAGRALWSGSSADYTLDRGLVPAAPLPGTSKRSLRDLPGDPWPLVLAMVLVVLGLGSCSLIPPPNPDLPGIALLYGVGDYANFNDLSGPPNDINILQEVLDGSGWQVSSRVNNSATAANFTTDIQNLPSQVVRGQRVLIYFSGHGVSPELAETLEIDGLNQEAIAFHDAQFTTTEAYYTPSRLQTLITPLLDTGALVLLVIDACYSGGFVSDGSYVNGLPYNHSDHEQYLEYGEDGGPGAALARYFSAGNTSADDQGHGFSAPNLWVMSAAGPAEESWEASIGGQQNGIFTAYFVDSATNGDLNSDGHVTFYESYRYAKAALEKQWNPDYELGFGVTNYDYQFLPHINGNPYDLSLFSR